MNVFPVCLKALHLLQGFDDLNSESDMVWHEVDEDGFAAVFCLGTSWVEGQIRDHEQGSKRKPVAVACRKKGGALHFNGLRPRDLKTGSKVAVELPEALVRCVGDADMVDLLFLLKDGGDYFLNREVRECRNFGRKVKVRGAVASNTRYGDEVLSDVVILPQASAHAQEDSRVDGEEGTQVDDKRRGRRADLEVKDGKPQLLGVGDLEHRPFVRHRRVGSGEVVDVAREVGEKQIRLEFAGWRS